MFDLIPVAVVVMAGTVAIVLRSQQVPRSGVHAVLLSFVLIENALALLARRRHPTAALLGVLATYALVDNEATTLLPVLVAVFTVVTTKARQIVAFVAVATAVLIVATPVIHGDAGGLLIHTLLPLLVLGLAVAAGSIRRAGWTAPFRSAYPTHASRRQTCPR